MVLIRHPDLYLDIVYKNLWSVLATMQENVKLILYYRNYYIGFDFWLILLLLKYGKFFEEDDNTKKDLFEILSSRHGKVVFALLNKL